MLLITGVSPPQKESTMTNLNESLCDICSATLQEKDGVCLADVPNGIVSCFLCVLQGLNSGELSPSELHKETLEYLNL